MHVRFQEEVFFQDTFVKQQLNIVETPLTANSLATRLFTTATVTKVRPTLEKLKIYMDMSILIYSM